MNNDILVNWFLNIEVETIGVIVIFIQKCYCFCIHVVVESLMMSVSVTMAYYVSKSNIYARSNTIETPFFNISQKVFFLIEGFSDYLVGNVCEIILLKCWHFVMKFGEKSAITTQPATTASFIALEFCLRFILEEWNHFFQIILFLHHFFYFLSELYKFPFFFTKLHK